MIYTCCNELRRNAVDEHPSLNGIDYLEVLDHDAPPGSPRQQTLMIRMLKSVDPNIPETDPVPALTTDRVRIDGGERVRDIGVLWVAPASAPDPSVSAAEQAFFTNLPKAHRVLLVRTDVYGDFSTYRLRLVRSSTNDAPPPGFDPQLREIEFSFKVECESRFDCAPRHVCPETPPADPRINYLAKDYASFRQLLMDRLSRLVPDWRERSAADLGVALAELIAYVGDRLSYEQDAVATEAYLETARRRVSLRRHALLVDYRMHDGCNARAWVQVAVAESTDPTDPVPLAFGTRFLTLVPEHAAEQRIEPGSRIEELALLQGPEVFGAMHDATLYRAHNTLSFYTWGDQQCCLPRGATRATLEGHLADLEKGDVLIFEEVKGPLTSEPGDADPEHRHAVRLTDVVHTVEGENLIDPLTDQPNREIIEITEIAWDEADALPFALCISAVTDEEHGSEPISDVSVALGNVVLVDHGSWITGESLGSVPPPRRTWAASSSADRCAGERPDPVMPRFAPRLAEWPLTQAASLSTVDNGTKSLDPGVSARDAFVWNMDDVVPVIELHEAGEAEPWNPERDLLSSRAAAHDFVVEIEHDGTTTLRFGDDSHGERPNAGATFTAAYRVGNGTAGNVGAAAIAHVTSADARIASARNPLPARGGRQLESAAEVRRRAPRAFRTLERAVTQEDYAEVTAKHESVQRAAATLRWTGSWHTMFVTVDRVGGEPITAQFERDMVAHVEPYRLAGHDLEFNAPIDVSLEIEMLVCVDDEYFRSDVEAALLEVFSNRDLADGRRGVFHPDEFTFGQTVYLSPLYAVARTVPGVASVEATTFQRQGIDDDQYLTAGKMTLGRLEIARLDNDRSFPEHGELRFKLFGGK